MIANGKLRQAMRKVARKRGDFTLFALFMRSYGPGSWDLVVSAPWLDKKGRGDAIGEVIKLLGEAMRRRTFTGLARVEVVKQNHPEVDFILENFPVDDGERHVRNTDFFGFKMDGAIIYRAKKVRPNRKGPPGKSRSSRGRRIKARSRPRAHQNV